MRVAAARRPRDRARPRARGRRRAMRTAPRAAPAPVVACSKPPAEGARRRRSANTSCRSAGRVSTLIQSSIARAREGRARGSATWRSSASSSADAASGAPPARACRRGSRPGGAGNGGGAARSPTRGRCAARARRRAPAARGYVVAQRRREHQEQRRARVDRGIPVREVGDAVQRHGGLAGAGGAADHDQAAGRVISSNCSASSRPAMSGRRLSARRAPARSVPSRRAPPRPRDAQRAPSPPASRGALAAHRRPPRALGTNTPSGASMRSSAPPRIGTVRRASTCPLAPADLLLVLLALLVAVVELRDRRVAPVDDAHAVLEAGGAPETEVALAAVLAQPQVREVRRRRVDARGRARRRSCASTAL